MHFYGQEETKVLRQFQAPLSESYQQMYFLNVTRTLTLAQPTLLRHSKSLPNLSFLYGTKVVTWQPPKGIGLQDR